MKNIIFTIALFYSLISFSQIKDSLTYKLNNYEVYKQTKTETFYVKNDKDKIIYKDLKFVAIVFEYLQVLDSKNNLSYIDQDGKKSTKTNIELGLCGTVANYILEIVEKDDEYIITKNENFYDYGDKIAPEVIKRINKKGITAIYFGNKEKQISYDENSFVFSYTNVYPEVVFIEKGIKQGLLIDDTILYYDRASYQDGIIKIEDNELVGYYNITTVKYKSLEPYVYRLAKFTMANEKSGFVDVDGREYFD